MILIKLLIIYLAVLFLGWLYVCFSPYGFLSREKLTLKVVSDFITSYLVAAFIVPFYIVADVFCDIREKF